jgi:hypothetical protein
MLAGLGQMRIAADVTLEDRARGVSLGTYDVSKTFAWGGVYGAATKLADIEEGFADAVVAVVLGDTPEPPASSTAVPAAAPTAPASGSLEERSERARRTQGGRQDYRGGVRHASPEGDRLASVIHVGPLRR